MFNLFKRNSSEVTKEKSSFVAVVSSLFNDWFPTNRKTPLSLVPVYACIKIISQTIAIADLKIYKRTDKGREELPKHKLAKLFKAPFKEMTYFNWEQMMMLQLAGYGNAYALIVRDINYNVKELVPLEYDMVNVIKDFNSSTYYYQVTVNAKTFSVFPENMLHYKIFSEDGIRGLSPIEMFRSTMDSMYSEADYLKGFYDKAANLSGTIESEGVTQKQIDAIKDKFESKYGGSANSGKTIILPNGMKYKQLKLLSPMDANYIETAKLNRSDIGVIFGVPLSLLGDLSQATYSNLSELNRAFYKMTIAPYFKAISQENDMKLLNESAKSTHYFEFDPEILLSMNKKERYETYAVGIRNGIVTRNEVRELENLEKLDGLDEVLQESGVLTTTQADNQFVKEEIIEVEHDGSFDIGNDSNNSTGNSDSSNNDDTKGTALMQKQINDLKGKLGRMEALQTAPAKTPNKDKK